MAFKCVLIVIPNLNKYLIYFKFKLYTVIKHNPINIHMSIYLSANTPETCLLSFQASLYLRTLTKETKSMDEKHQQDDCLKKKLCETKNEFWYIQEDH